MTQSYEELIHNIRGIAPRLVVPMHFNALFTVESFLSQVASQYPVKRSDSSTIIVSRDQLPVKTEILLLRPKLYQRSFGSEF